MRTIKFTANDNCTVGELLTSNSVSKRLIRRLKHTQNAISKNGRQISTSDTLTVGESIEIMLFDEKTLLPNDKLCAAILYEDEDIVAFDKPFGMPVHPSLLHYDDSLGNLFAAMYPNTSFRPLNRLDKDTTGICVCAKNAYAASLIQKSLNKVYYAAVCGFVSGKDRIDLPIARVDGSIIKRQVSDTGQRAVTDYETVLYSQSRRYTLIKIILGTGRTHQIRVHLSHMGYPLAGDDMYGGDLSDIRRQALHCSEVSFIKPDNKKTVVKSDLPEDIKQLMNC